MIEFKGWVDSASLLAEADQESGWGDTKAEEISHRIGKWLAQVQKARLGEWEGFGEGEKVRGTRWLLGKEHFHVRGKLLE